jgi:hypothetical protein
MTTATAAFAVIRSVMEGATPLNPKTSEALAMRWRGEPNPPLPNTPAPFVYTLFSASRSGFIENGGGAGHNRHRNPGAAEILIFIPNDWGEAEGTKIAEAFQALFLSYSDNGVTVTDATVYPGGSGSDIAVPGLEEPGNYIWAGCDVEFYFDQIG